MHIGFTDMHDLNGLIFGLYLKIYLYPDHFLFITFSSCLTASEQENVRMKYMAVMVIQISKVW